MSAAACFIDKLCSRLCPRRITPLQPLVQLCDENKRRTQVQAMSSAAAAGVSFAMNTVVSWMNRVCVWPSPTRPKYLYLVWNFIRHRIAVRITFCALINAATVWWMLVFISKTALYNLLKFDTTWSAQSQKHRNCNIITLCSPSICLLVNRDVFISVCLVIIMSSGATID